MTYRDAPRKRRHTSMRIAMILACAGIFAACSNSAATLAPTQGSTTSATGSPATATSATGSPATAAPSPSKASKKLGLILAQNNVARWTFDSKGFTDMATQLGDTYTVVGSNASAATQSNQVDAMITSKVDALVLTPVDIATAGSLFAKAKDAGIPTVDYNFIVPNISPNYIIARRAVDFGVFEAQAAVKAFPTGNYVIVGGDPGTSVAMDEVTGYMQVLQPFIDSGKIKIVSQKMNLNWSPSLAQAQVEEALVKTGNNIQAILAGSDSMAIPAMTALKNAGLLGKVFVSGVDCDLANIQAIAQGFQSVCIWTDFYKMGQYAALAADAAARGIPLDLKELSNLPNGNVSVPTVMMETVVVDQPGLCSWLKSSQWVPFADAYKFVSPTPTC